MSTHEPITARDLISVPSPASSVDEVAGLLDRTKALLPGHFALQRERHTPIALRFRAIARDREALETVGVACRKLATGRWRWPDVMVLSPESAGFFLAAEIARTENCLHAVAQTDLRRRPTRQLTAGTIAPGASVVIINDVSTTGDSLKPMLELVRESKAHTVGVVLFAVVGVKEFVEFYKREELIAEWLVTAEWESHTPGEKCPGCRDKKDLIPIAEFA